MGFNDDQRREAERSRALQAARHQRQAAQDRRKAAAERREERQREREQQRAEDERLIEQLSQAMRTRSAGEALPPVEPKLGRGFGFSQPVQVRPPELAAFRRGAPEHAGEKQTTAHSGAGDQPPLALKRPI